MAVVAANAESLAGWIAVVSLANAHGLWAAPGMGDRVLSWEDGERHMTDLAHITQLLQEVAHREYYTLPALRDWLRRQRDERSGATERNRRLDSDAAAVIFAHPHPSGVAEPSHADEASVQADRAAQEAMRLQLQFTRVLAPIDGVAGVAQATA